MNYQPAELEAGDLREIEFLDIPRVLGIVEMKTSLLQRGLN